MLPQDRGITHVIIYMLGAIGFLDLTPFSRRKRWTFEGVECALEIIILAVESFLDGKNAGLCGVAGITRRFQLVRKLWLKALHLRFQLVLLQSYLMHLLPHTRFTILAFVHLSLRVTAFNYVWRWFFGYRRLRAYHHCLLNARISPWNAVSAAKSLHWLVIGYCAAANYSTLLVFQISPDTAYYSNDGRTVRMLDIN